MPVGDTQAAVAWTLYLKSEARSFQPVLYSKGIKKKWKSCSEAYKPLSKIQK